MASVWGWVEGQYLIFEDKYGRGDKAEKEHGVVGGLPDEVRFEQRSG